MYIIELILALQGYDFSIPERDELNTAISKKLECQQVTGYREECANTIDKLIHTKEKLGGIYVYYQ